MKKFIHLAPGESFEYQGKPYIKTGPLTARNIDDNGQRMIPRSAVVLPLTESASTPDKAVKQRHVQTEQVLQAFDLYHKGCLEWVQLTDEVDASLASRIREAMELARKRFLAELEQLSEEG